MNMPKKSNCHNITYIQVFGIVSNFKEPNARRIVETNLEAKLEIVALTLCHHRSTAKGSAVAAARPRGFMEMSSFFRSLQIYALGRCAEPCSTAPCHLPFETLLWEAQQRVRLSSIEHIEWKRVCWMDQAGGE